MKKIKKILILIFAISLFGVVNTYAQAHLKVPPAPSKKKIPPRPNKYEVWVPEEWQFINNKYYHLDGYWTFPPTSKSHYVKGYWKKSKAGYERIPGYWATSK